MCECFCENIKYLQLYWSHMMGKKKNEQEWNFTAMHVVIYVMHMRGI